MRNLSDKYRIVVSKPAGFTLVELVIGMGLLAMLFILGTQFVVSGFKSLNFSSEQEIAVQNSRRVMDTVSKEIRETIYSDRSDYPLSIIEPQEFSFYSDSDGDGQIEKIRYFIDGSSFKKGVIEPGAYFDYSSAETVSDVADYINNQTEPIFFYYDSNYDATTVINNVRLVKVKLKINVTPEVAPADYYLESDIQLRNLKDNL